MLFSFTNQVSPLQDHGRSQLVSLCTSSRLKCAYFFAAPLCSADGDNDDLPCRNCCCVHSSCRRQEYSHDRENDDLRITSKSSPLAGERFLRSKFEPCSLFVAIVVLSLFVLWFCVVPGHDLVCRVAIQGPCQGYHEIGTVRTTISLMMKFVTTDYQPEQFHDLSLETTVNPFSGLSWFRLRVFRRPELSLLASPNRRVVRATSVPAGRTWSLRFRSAGRLSRTTFKGFRKCTLVFLLILVSLAWKCSLPWWRRHSPARPLDLADDSVRCSVTEVLLMMLYLHIPEAIMFIVIGIIGGGIGWLSFHVPPWADGQGVGLLILKIAGSRPAGGVRNKLLGVRLLLSRQFCEVGTGVCEEVYADLPLRGRVRSHSRARNSFRLSRASSSMRSSGTLPQRSWWPT